MIQSKEVDLAEQPFYRRNTIPRIAAIVPAYNEAGRISKVLKVLSRVEYVSEIIVVDDGSTDGTGAEARQAAQNDGRVRVLCHPKNFGKGQALFTGWDATRAPFLLLLDADLINLKPEHITDLAEPVLSGEVDMTLGLFERGYWRTDLAHRITPWLSGQRCIRAELLQDLSERAAEGYGFETALSIEAHQQGWRCRNIPLTGVSHPPGEIPRSGWHGPWTKVKMFAQILRAWFLCLRWQEQMPRLLRRMRLVVILSVTMDINLGSSFSMSTAGLLNFILIKCLNSEMFWLLWGELKAAGDLLQQ